MSRVRLAIIFFASVALGNAAAALQLGASEAVAAVQPPCPCSFCDHLYGCFYAVGYTCGLLPEGGCYSYACKPNQNCF